MAKKSFEIQGARLRIGGLDLEAGISSVVIPGITQAANYAVEEVEDYGDQSTTFSSVPTVIDSITFGDWVNDGTSTGRATYIVEELDDDGYIDGIEVDNSGTYTSDESSVNAGSDMLAYVGSAEDPFASFDSNDWAEIPFRPRMRAGDVENVGGGGGSGDQLVSGTNTFALMEEGDVVFDGEGFGGVNRGLVWNYGVNQDGVNSMVRQDGEGLTVSAYTENGGGGPTGDDGESGYSAPVRIVTNQDTDQKTWTFDGAGTLTFPDGSQQTSAYTGGSAGGGPLFVVVNNSGEIAYSTDATTWQQVPQFQYNGNNQNFQRVAIASSYIAYIGVDDQLFYSTDIATEPVLSTITGAGSGSYSWRDIETNGTVVVAAGWYDDGSNPIIPVWAYTANGATWTLGSVDPGYQDFASTSKFTSVDYNGSGWMIGAGDSNDQVGTGAFYITNLSDTLGETNFINFGVSLGYVPDFDSVVWTGSNWFLRNTSRYEGPFGSVDQKLYVSSGADPLTSTWTEIDLSLVSTMNEFNLSGAGFYEATGGNGTYMIASSEGQILSTSDLGDTWTTAVPEPYYGTIPSITQGTTTFIDGYTMVYGGPNWSPGQPFRLLEKITISNAVPSGYNGTHYIQTFGVPAFNLRATDPFVTNNTNWITGDYTDIPVGDFTVSVSIGVNGQLNGIEITATGTNIYGVLDEFTISGDLLGGTAEVDDLIVSPYDFANGTREYRVYTDASYATLLDTSGLDPFVSGDFALHRGTYIDSVGFGLDKFLIGNDAEQVWTSPDAETWTKVDDQDNGFNYWNDISFISAWGTNSSSQLTNGSQTLTLNDDGSVTFPDGTIQHTAYLGGGSLPSFLTEVTGTNHLPTRNTDYGWDSNGIWFTNATITSGNPEGTSYPIRTAAAISASVKTTVSVNFVENDSGADFGIAFFENADAEWAWDPSVGTRLAAQYNGLDPEIYDGNNVSGNANVIQVGNTYRAVFTYDPTADGLDPGEALLTFETYDLSGTLLDTVTLTTTAFTQDYWVGFGADQDDGTTKTYMYDLAIDIDNGATSYFSALSLGGVETGNFTFSGDTVTNSAGMLLATGRGTLALGTDMEVPGVPTHFHIAFDGSNTSVPTSDLFFGDDYNYVKLGAYASGVQIGINERGDGTPQHAWSFSNEGDIVYTVNNNAALSISGFSNTISSQLENTLSLSSGYDLQLSSSDGNEMGMWTLTLDQTGKLIVPGPTILPTATPTPGTASVGRATAISVTNGPNTNWSTLNAETSGIGVTINFIVDGSGNATVEIVDGGSGFSGGETFTILGTAFPGGTSPADDANLEITAIDTDIVTALDLTKQVQKLGAPTENGLYSLADGVEGQIMYFVPAAATTFGVTIQVASARWIDSITGEVYQDAGFVWVPFSGMSPSSTLATAIFAGGYWNLQGGGSI